jgi:hypothetical protein
MASRAHRHAQAALSVRSGFVLPGKPNGGRIVLDAAAIRMMPEGWVYGAGAHDPAWGTSGGLRLQGAAIPTGIPSPSKLSEQPYALSEADGPRRLEELAN